jgi:hypothetical protein
MRYETCISHALNAFNTDVKRYTDGVTGIVSNITDTYMPLALCVDSPVRSYWVWHMRNENGSNCFRMLMETTSWDDIAIKREECKI